MMTRRLAILACVPLLAMSACADDDDAEDATPDDTTTTTTTTVAPTDERRDVDDQQIIDDIVAAADNTVDAGTAAFTIEIRTEGADTDQEIEPIVIEGEVDFDEGRRWFSFGDNGEGIEVVVDDATAYIQLPATEDDDWVEIDLEELLDADVGVGGPAGIPYQDPSDNLRILQGTVTSVEEAGTDTIDGDDTEHYRLMIDLEAASEEADDDIREAAQRTIDQTGLQELQMEVWIDEDDTIRRVGYVLDLEDVDFREDDEVGEVEVDPQFRTTVTLDYTSVGDPVDIEIPDPDNLIVLDEEEIRDTVRELDPEQSGTNGTGTTTTTTTP